MSLYTISALSVLSSVKIPAGLTMEESTDITLLSVLGYISREEVIKRLANDNLAFVAFIDNRPAAFGWMARGKAKIGELNHEFILPIGNRYLWNFRTVEAFRGKGIYPVLIQYILQLETAKANRFWIIHAPENTASLKGIKKAGFQYVGRLYNDVNGNTVIEANDIAFTYRDQLEYMDIIISQKTAASCWNCSSPYLKKRKETCCCTEAGSECLGNRKLSMAY
jgi:RimJ/RimL family protein N-acetyltransferase